MDSNLNQLNQLLEENKDVILSLGVNEIHRNRLVQYCENLVKANLELNLFSRKMSMKDLVENHIFDSLLALSEFQKLDFENLGDFGSGGGLPGLILAACFPEKQIHLFEKSPKKRQFLEAQNQYLNNITVYDEVNDKYLGKLDLVTARAFKPLDVILKLSRKYHQSGGKYLLFKGRLETIKEEIHLSKLKNEPQLIQLNSPFLKVERYLVKIGF